MTAPGLLIINADDWGLDAATTDAIERCFAAGAVTSASAMVFMEDSQRAASIARQRGRSVGLHINLTEALTDGGVPVGVRDRQQRLVEYFAGPPRRRWAFSPTHRAEVERAIADQLGEFRRLYASEPTHLDGHQHIHQALTVLAARTLPRGARMRPSFTFAAGEKTPLNRASRRLLNAIMAARFRTPRYFFSIRDMHPALGGVAMEGKLALASGAAVEVMTHPGWDDELAILLDPAWKELVGLRRLGGYESL